MDGADDVGSLQQLVIGPGDVATQDLRADGAVQHQRMTGVELVGDGGVAHADTFCRDERLQGADVLG